MNKETIKKAADEFANREYETSVVDRDYLHKGFYHGALWRINAAWHNTYDIAEPGKDCLVEYMDGDGNVCIRIDWRSEYEWVNACHYDKILRWAYVSDLVPDGNYLPVKKMELNKLRDEAYTLQDVLDALPDFINEYCLIIDMSFGVIRYDNLTRKNNPVLKETYFNDEGNTLIDAAYEMLCWCIENGYVETNNQ